MWEVKRIMNVEENVSHVCVKFWLKIIALPVESLLGSCYALNYRSVIRKNKLKIRDIKRLWFWLDMAAYLLFSRHCST